LHDRAVRDHARRPALERAREERPRDEPGEEEDRVRLVTGRGARGRAEQDAEEDREHHELQQRDEEVPREPERRALVPRAQLAPGEVADELAALVESGEVGDHAGVTASTSATAAW